MQLAAHPSSVFTTFSPAIAEWRHLDVAQRLARVVRRLCDRFGDPDYPVSLEELANEPETCDLNETEIREHSGRSKQLLADGAAEPPPYDREGRIQLGSSLILGLMPAIPSCHTTLREANFTNKELGDLWDDIIARAADAFHADRAPLKPTGSRTAPQKDDLPDWGRIMLERNAE